VKAFCHFRNVSPLADGHIAWFARHGSHFPGKLLPFGSLVDFLSAGPFRKDKPKMDAVSSPVSCWGTGLTRGEVEWRVSRR
jgi:hypothetical protein